MSHHKSLTDAWDSVESRPDLYDWTYAEYTADLAYWSSVVDDSFALELGVGSGRVAIPLTLFGKRVVGLDRSRNMLSTLRRRCVELGIQVPAVCGTMDRLPFSSASFDVVFCPFGTMNYCLSQIETLSVLNEVRRVLKPGGRFIFEVLAWSTWPRWLTNDGHEHLVKCEETCDWTISMCCTYSYDAATQLAQQHRRYELWDRMGARDVRFVHWINRYAAAGEWRLLLQLAGLDISRELGDYDGGPFRHSSEFLLLECFRQ